MAGQEIKGEDYSVKYDPESTTINFEGELSLGGPSEYEPIATFLNEVADASPAVITINLRSLGFLNSSGISMLSKFVLRLRNKTGTRLVILGSNDQPWQGKSLQNLVRLLPGLKLEVI